MTAQPTRDQLLDMTEDLGFLGDRPELCDQVVDGLWAALAQAEHRIARLEAQTDIRGRAVVIYRDRARKAEAWAEYQNEEVDLLEVSLDRAEARIKAVRELVDQDGADRWWVQEWGRHAIPIADIRRALEGEGA